LETESSDEEDEDEEGEGEGDDDDAMMDDATPSKAGEGSSSAQHPLAQDTVPK
jgi:histone chaperone ASF1